MKFIDGKVEVPEGGRTYIISWADLLADRLKPPPLFSERRFMEGLSQGRLGLYLVWRSVYFRLPFRLARTRPVRWLHRRMRFAG